MIALGNTVLFAKPRGRDDARPYVGYSLRQNFVIIRKGLPQMRQPL